MSAGQFENRLETDSSQSVTQKKDGSGESDGYHSGRRIVDILSKKSSEYTEDDIAQMRRVISCVQRHLAQGSADEVTCTHYAADG